jgi:hypothetical protein
MANAEYGEMIDRLATAQRPMLATQLREIWSESAGGRKYRVEHHADLHIDSTQFLHDGVVATRAVARHQPADITIRYASSTDLKYLNELARRAIITVYARSGRCDVHKANARPGIPAQARLKRESQVITQMLQVIV